IVMTTALMRPTGISDMDLKSVKKKFKDKKFAAGCSRDVIQGGCDMLGLPLDVVMECTIKGMREHMDELGIGPKE
ncbi:MAG: hydrolase, partial [Oscillospiraceae bacterium]|nr:hydrolase [Oscillospiraceae bacterium]